LYNSFSKGINLNNQKILEIFKNHFYNSLTMLEKTIDQCPDNMWYKKHGGFPIWQQILHAAESIYYWMRINDEEYILPFEGKKVYYELNQQPVDILTKKEIEDFFNIIKFRCNDFFTSLRSIDILNKSKIEKSLTFLDIILLQIRHIQYHVGHINSILRENDLEPVQWIE